MVDFTWDLCVLGMVCIEGLILPNFVYIDESNHESMVKYGPKLFYSIKQFFGQIVMWRIFLNFYG